MSAAETEHAALSQGMRELLSAKDLLKQVADHMHLEKCAASHISKAHKDNQAALLVAAADPPRLKARNKHWNTKRHWFRQHSGAEMQLLPISAQAQVADAFTEGLKEPEFAKF